MIDALLQSALSKDPAQRPESASAFAAKLYALQFLGEAPLNVNTTAQTLVTMVTVTSSTGGEAASTPALGSPRDALHDTSVDAELPSRARAENGADRLVGAPTVNERARTPPAAEPAAAVLESVPARPRSFADA